MAAKVNLSCEQGATFERVIRWTSSGSLVNLAGCTARLQVRRRASAGSVLLSLSPGSGISFPALGEIGILVTAEQTAGIPEGVWRYDLEVETGSGRVTRLIEGAFTVSAEVTR